MELTAQYPSNIALVKYWGKKGQQLPCNSSLSLTLREAHTRVKVTYEQQHSAQPAFQYFFEGQHHPAFEHKVHHYLKAQPEFQTFLAHHTIRVDSENTFPHSTGIASSASAFAAIAAVFLKLSQPNLSTAEFRQKGSRLARLGSGSASRSFYGPYALWGELAGVPDSTDDYAIPIEEIHPNFQAMRDCILIVEQKTKKVSSTLGHGLMKEHPYAHQRFQEANHHSKNLLEVLQIGDFEQFISITESEALSLHAMMMTSKEYYLLMKPETIQIINTLFEYREATGTPVCFTLDAGPNVHLLYPESQKNEVHRFVESELRPFTKSLIYDQMGVGGQVF